MYKKFLTIYIMTVSLLLLPIGVNTLFLFSVDEFTAPELIADKQLNASQTSLAACGTHDLTVPYKSALYKKTNPDIIAIGSSRMMPFREDMFNARFINLSRAMNDIEQGYQLVDDLLKQHVPKLALVGTDFWWFTGHYTTPSLYIPPDDKAEISLKTLILPFKWLQDGKINTQYYKNSIFSLFKNEHSANLGITAQVKGDGFYSDGSYYHSSISTGKTQSLDAGFQETLFHIKNGTGLFGHHLAINQQKITRFIEMLELLKSKGVNVIVFNHPLSPPVKAAMRDAGQAYQYKDIIMQELSAQVDGFIDFDSEGMQFDACEFLDGYHAGEIILSRLMEMIAQQNAGVSTFLNNERIKANIQHYQGLAFKPDPRFFATAEIDFLQLGCAKTLS